MTCHCSWETGQTEGHVVNFSYGGAAILGDAATPCEGDDVRIIFAGAGQPVEMDAHVSWQRGPQFGIEFYASAEDRRRKLLPVFQRCVAAAG